jgi:hypothetical protein
MKINMLVKLALAFALVGSAVVGTMSFQKDERIVLAGDPTQWKR